MNTSEQINEIAAALAKAQGAMRPAIKDSVNPAFRSKYADLAANVEAARGPLAANNLAVVQEVTTVERGVAVATRIIHASGQWIQMDPLTVPLSKQDAHGVGSAVSYSRKYALGAALGLVADDDDGNAATGQDQRSRRVQTPAAAVTTPAGPVDATPAPAQDDMPPGFVAWVEDLESVAVEGSERLKATWTKSRPELRKHLTTFYPEQWDSLKKKAAAVQASA